MKREKIKEWTPNPKIEKEREVIERDKKEVEIEDPVLKEKIVKRRKKIKRIIEIILQF